MNPQEARNLYDVLDSKPDFAELDYETQVSVRKKLAEQFAPSMPGFGQLDPLTQNKVLEKLTFALPSLKNKNLQDYVAAQMKLAQDGDKNAMRFLQGYQFNVMNAQDSLVVKGANAVTEGIMKAFGSGPDAYSPKNGFIPGIDAAEQFSSADARKLADWVNYTASQDARFAKVKGAGSFGAVLGGLADVLALYVLTPNVVGGLAKTAMAGRAANTGSAFGRLMWRSFLPQLAETGTAGAMNVIKDNLNAVFTQRPELYTKTFADATRSFGQGAGWDLALGMVGRELVVPVVGLLGKVFRKTPVEQLPKTLDELGDYIKKAGTSGDIPDVLKRNFDTMTQDNIWMRDETAKILDQGIENLNARPRDRAVVGAASMPGVTVRELDTGAYRVAQVSEDGISVYEAPSVHALNQRLGEIAVSQFDNLDEAKALKKEMGHNAWMIDYGIAARSGESILDPAAAVKKQGYIGAGNRSYVSALEVDNAAGSGQGVTMRVDAPFGADEAKRVVKAKSMFPAGGVMDAKRSVDGKMVVTVANPAPPGALDEAAKWVEDMMKSSPDTDPETLRAMYLSAQGYDGIVKSADEVQTFFPDKVKWIADEVNPKTGMIEDLSVGRARVTAATSNRAYAAARVEATIGKDTLKANPQAIADTMISEFKGELNTTKMAHFTKTLVGENGLSIKVVRGTKADALDEGKSLVRIVRQGDTLEVHIPKSITGPEAQKKFIRDYIDKINGVARKAGDAPIKMNVATTYKRSAAKFASAFADEASQVRWLNDVAERYLGAKVLRENGKYLLETTAGQEVYDSMAELTDAVVMRSVSPEFVTKDLARQGYKITKTDAGYTASGPNLNGKVEASSIQDLADRLGYRPERLSNAFAPPEVVINQGSVTISYNGQMSVGSRKHVYDLMAKFDDPNELATMIRIDKVGENDVYKLANGGVRVDVPKFGASMHFETPTDAKKFITTELKTFGGKKVLAMRKGLDFSYQDGHYVIGDGQNLYTAANDEELAKVFQQFPDSPGLREVFSGLNPQADAEIADILSQVDQAMFRKWQSFNRDTTGWLPGHISEDIKIQDVSDFRDQFRATFSEFSYWKEMTLPKYGLRELGRNLDQLALQSKAYEMATSRDHKLLIEMFSIGEGKKRALMPLERRRAIWHIMGAQTAEELDAKVAEFGKLSPHEEAVAYRLQELLGKRIGTNATGLAGKYGIPARQFVDNYMPRIKSWMSLNKEELNKLTTADELLQRVYGDSVPHELSAWFYKSRVSELAQAALDDDALSVLTAYTRAGNRKLYMNEAWQQIDRYLTANSGKIPGDVVQRVNRYREQLLGIYKTKGEQAIENIGQALMRELVKTGKVNPQNARAGRDLLQTYYSMTYLANLGFRPSLAIRNTMQVFTTLAPRFGNQWVMDAVGKVLHGSDDYILYLKRLGVVSEAPPLVNEIVQSTSKLGKVTQRALRSFKNSDDVTRAIAYATGDIRLTEAVEKLQKGLFKDREKFIKYAGLHLLRDTDPDFVENILKNVDEYVAKGTIDNLENARFLYGQKISNDTMFGYHASNSPTLFSNSLLGKMFGQYGTYSAGYRANIYRAFQNGTFKDKVMFVNRFIGNNLALLAAFSALGIKTSDFIPGSPAFFGGGPNFELAVNMMQALGSGPTAKQARNAVARSISPIASRGGQVGLNYPRIAPGSMQLYYLGKAIQYLDQGEIWKAFLSMTATPVNSSV